MAHKDNGTGARLCWALALAGGDGTRLQDLTRLISGAPIPKQYCPLLHDGHSLLEATLLRARHFVPPERTLVIVNQDHLGIAAPQLRPIPATNVLVQPQNRDTGPGIIFALLQLARRDAAATVALLPSDHYVSDDRAFMTYVAEAARLVNRFPDKLVMLGIVPDRPETEYGYILPGEALPDSATSLSAFQARAFHEKPDPTLAQALCGAGGLWNSFVTIFRAERLLALVQKVAPTEFAALAPLRNRPRDASRVYRRIAAWNFSRTVLARIPEELIVLPVEGLHWSDWGTQASIERSLRLLNRKPLWGAVQPGVEDRAPLAVAARARVRMAPLKMAGDHGLHGGLDKTAKRTRQLPSSGNENGGTHGVRGQ